MFLSFQRWLYERGQPSGVKSKHESLEPDLADQGESGELESYSIALDSLNPWSYTVKWDEKMSQNGSPYIIHPKSGILGFKQNNNELGPDFRLLFYRQDMNFDLTK